MALFNPQEGDQSHAQPAEGLQTLLPSSLPLNLATLRGQFMPCDFSRKAKAFVSGLLNPPHLLAASPPPAPPSSFLPLPQISALPTGKGQGSH